MAHGAVAHSQRPADKPATRPVGEEFDCSRRNCSGRTKAHSNFSGRVARDNRPPDILAPRLQSRLQGLPQALTNCGEARRGRCSGTTPGQKTAARCQEGRNRRQPNSRLYVIPRRMHDEKSETAEGMGSTGRDSGQEGGLERGASGTARSKAFSGTVSALPASQRRKKGKRIMKRQPSTPLS